MKNSHSTIRFCMCVALASIALSLSSSAIAQTSEFTFQGKLPGTFNPATGTYQMEFKLFDSATGGNQIGSTMSNSNVAVTLNAFSVVLDFGANAFPGADRFIEIAARKSPNDQFTVVSQRQKVTSAPYSIKSKSADTAGFAVAADTANVATRAFNAIQFGGLDVGKFVRYDDNDNVGIGTTSNGAKLAVGGLIESKSGGIKFPDTSVQSTAGITSVATNGTLAGNGTSASPLGVASPLMVRDLDNPARQPWTATRNASDPSSLVVIVPTGKVLVIETVTASVRINGYTLPAGDVSLNVYIHINLQRSFDIAPSFFRVISGNSLTSYTHNVRFYLVAFEELRVSIPDSSLGSIGQVVLSGYWVDVP